MTLMSGLYAKLIEEISETEDLVDIAPRGRAAQSSMSRWSRDNDAQRAVRADVGADYAFHTDFEQNPWWEITFDEEVSPAYVVVHNRKNPRFQALSCPLRVLVKKGDDEFNEIYKGKLQFGSQPNSMPLILPLQSQLSFDTLRLELANFGPLHLSKVSILADRSVAEMSHSTMIAAVRTDGLGQRLWAMVNAIAIANKDPKINYGFSWRIRRGASALTHAITAADEMFASEYLEKYLLQQPVDERIAPNIGAKVIAHSEDPLEQMRHNRVVISTNGDLLARIPRLGSILSSRDFAEAFASIQFAPKMEAARQAAEDVAMSNDATAIHMRAGDIIYGRFRFMDAFLTKATPYPIVEKIIEKEQTQGRSVILFGQDGNLASALSAKHGVAFSDHLSEKSCGSDAEKAIFDIVLMARCSRIVGGTSGFCQLSSIVGGGIILDPRSFFDEASILSIIQQSRLMQDEAVSDLQKSFASRYAAYFCGGSASEDEYVELMVDACRLDSANDYYKLVLAAKFVSMGNAEAAESLLKQGRMDTDPGSLFDVLTYRHPNGKLPATTYITEMLGNQGELREFTRACLLFYCDANQDRPECSEVADALEFGGEGSATVPERWAQALCSKRRSAAT